VAGSGTGTLLHYKLRGLHNRGQTADIAAPLGATSKSDRYIPWDDLGAFLHWPRGTTSLFFALGDADLL